MGGERIESPQKDDSGLAKPDKSETPEKKGSGPQEAHPSPQALGSPRTASPADIPLTHENILYLQRAIGNRAVARLLQRKVELSHPDDPFEQEADRVAEEVMTLPDAAASESAQADMSLLEVESIQTKSLASTITPLLQREAAPEAEPTEQGAGRANDGSPEAAQNLESSLSSTGGGSPLPDEVRSFMEPQFGADFSHVRVHTGGNATRMNEDLNAEAFTYEQNIYYGSGRSPANDALTAHELTHVIQQTGGPRARSISGPVPDRVGTKLIQRSLTGSFPVTHGGFEVDLQTREGAVNTPPTHSGLDGYIRFVPNTTAPNSNSIVIIQVVKLTDVGGTDVTPSSLPAAQAPRGALGQPGLRTQDDAARGVEGGYFTDVHHQPNAAGPAVPRGSALSPRYDFQPAAPGTTGTVGQTPQPAQYGAGIGGVVGQTPGFKRSSDPSDIRSAAMFDAPGVADPRWNLDFSFESVAMGEDTMITYGAVKWGFGFRAGRIINEHISVLSSESATFNEALERHRDFYVHEPVTFYFPFDNDVLSASEAAKIDAFLPYLTRNPTAQMSLEGFADIRGGASARNADLARRRAQSVQAAMLGRGIAPGRITGISVGEAGVGASTSATTNAGTGDQPGGTAAVGADQDRDANRQFNRRVVVTFSHAAAAPAPAPAGP
ncbi:MAG TPA: DUF4157 domain-containing protein [Pyrinomonadaceae bacterium]|jgi:outer membrane protein OmpA-like peptidoglycan-associated protein|nr:DUF4157 domain-containing protein [Pyrinomonadaceae bacterium]